MSGSALGAHGRILTADGSPRGTCFQIRPGFLATALHVVQEASTYGEVRFEPLERGHVQDIAQAKLFASDAAHDLAILKTETHLPASVPLFAYSDEQAMGLQVGITGFAMLPDGGRGMPYRSLPAPGTWTGPADPETGSAHGWVLADGVEKGMSGAPVVRQSDGAVVGVLTARRETKGVWSQGRVRVGRTERLLELLGDSTAVAVESKRVAALGRSARLADTPFDREQRRADETFVAPPSWDRSRVEARDALKSGEVLVVVAPAGIGSTTFAEQLLAHEAPEVMGLTTFDPGDWDGPAIGRLCPEPWQAHILDLKVSGADELSAEFVAGLSELAGCYRDMQARLVLTVRTELWQAIAGSSIADVRVLRLDDAPDSVQLIDRRMQGEAEALVPHLRGPKVEKHLQNLSAVRAAETARKLLREWNLWLRQAEPGTWEAALDRLLDNHTSELAEKFAPPHASAGPKVLSRDDRCFLIALAFLRTEQLDKLDRVSKSLAADMEGGKQPSDQEEPGAAYAALGGPGLVGRVERISARVLPGETVAFEQPAFGDAAARYTWDNYPSARRPIAEWLLRLAAETTGRRQLALEWLSELVRRHQDVAFVKKHLRALAAKHEAAWLLREVLVAGVKDPHMQRGCERILYDWAMSNAETTAAVAGRLLLEGVRTTIALRRLQRVADLAQTRTLDEDLQTTFESALRIPEVRGPVVFAFAAWLKDDPSKPSAKIALRALMNADSDSVPWLLTKEAADIDLSVVLGEALADETSLDALATVVSKASSDDLRYVRVIDAIAEAVVAQGSLSYIRLYPRFAGHDFSGRDPERDIDARVKLVAVDADEDRRPYDVPVPPALD